MKCPYCGAHNPAEENFCTNCGAYLDVSANALTLVSNSDTAATQLANTSLPHISGETGTAISGGGSEITRTLAPGEQLQHARYVVEKILGLGGMGTAVLARDTRVSNKHVVIKELVSENTDPTQHDVDVRNFEREVETLAHLDHPLIPTVTDSFQEGTRYYMVQEYVAGENLQDRLDRLMGPLPEHDILLYASQVLTILDYLARQHPPIVHRDIKPANIIISSKDNLAHLVDFGIARASETKNARRKQTSALGTPGYAPPEQYQGNADVRSDIYALAATMHHLLTNRDPSDYPAFDYPSVRSLNSILSPEIDRVLTRALALDITNRYQSAMEMKHDIDEILLNCFGEPSGDTTIYMRGYSGTISVSPPVTPVPQGRSSDAFTSLTPERRSSPVSREAPLYEGTRRQWQESIFDFEEPTRQQQQMQISEFERPLQQPQPMNRMYQQLYQDGMEQHYMLFSFVMLMVVIGIILLILFYLSTFGNGPF